MLNYEVNVFSEGCPDEMCMMHCPLGRKKDDNGKGKGISVSNATF